MEEAWINVAIALRAGEGWTYRFGIDFTVKAGEPQPGSGAAIFEYITRRGEEPPDHTHKTEDEMLYVVDRTITFRCREEMFDLARRDFIFLPRRIQHGYTISSDDPARLLVVASPGRDGSKGGWGGYVADLESGQAELIAKLGHAG